MPTSHAQSHENLESDLHGGGKRLFFEVPLNNIVEQDHRRIKRLVRPGLGFKSMSTARQIICGYEIFAMIRKGQVKGIPANDMGAQRTLIASLFAIAA